MKFFKTDFSLKHITLEMDGKHYLIKFRSSFLQGVHDVVICEGDGYFFVENENYKIKDTYPPIQARIGELVFLARRWVNRKN